MLFLRTRGGEDTVSCLWLLAGGAERLLVDPADLGPAGQVPLAEQIRRERAREQASGVVAYSADAQVRTVVFVLGARLWVTGLDGAAARPVPTTGPAIDPHIDPTGRRVAYVTGGALHVVELAGGRDRVLAAPDGPEVTYGLAEHIAAEEMHRPRGYWWSPDGEHLLAARVDISPVQRWWIADPANPQVPPREIAYPAAGTANADVSLHVLGVAGGRTEVSWDRTALEYLVTVGWDSFGPLVSVQSRDQRTVRILAADPATGATDVLHTETDQPWVQLTPGTPLRTGSGSLVRVSDLDGSRRLVVDGRPVTADGVQVREVLGADGESVLFAASREPTEVHLWSYHPQRGTVQVSAGPGVHSGCAAGGALVLISHTGSGRTFTFSRAGGPDAAIDCREAEPLLTPRITWLRAGHREIRTALLLPSWHQPGRRKLPVLMCPYSGPALQLVLRVRNAWFCEAQWFADCGFAVVIADGRGTPGRGPAWEKEVYGDTLSPVIEDQVTALYAAAEHCGDLDLARVGIRGWSYGGTLAAAAVIRAPRCLPHRDLGRRAERPAALRHALAGALPRPPRPGAGELRPQLADHAGRVADPAAAAGPRDGGRQRGGRAHPADVGGAAGGGPAAPGPAAVRRHPHAGRRDDRHPAAAA